MSLKMPEFLHILVPIGAGIALAAACGFRIFLPLLAASLAAKFDYINPSASFAWIESTPAIILFSVATLFELAAYYIPWLDHALDTIATPAAVVAGVVAAAAAFGDVHPAFKWTAAIIAGGGAAGTIQAATVLTRAVSGGTTAGLGNPIVATIELFFSLLLSLLAVLLPILALIVTVAILLAVLRRIARFVANRRRGLHVADARHA